MFYYLYQITNNLNGKIYVGVHKTSKMDDGYMGSGKVIKRAIEKHGIENFTKVILETFENAESMYAREAEVVTDAFLLREDVYNLRRGGHGGFDYLNTKGLANTKLGRINADLSINIKYGVSNVSRLESVRKKNSISLKKRHASGEFSYDNFRNKRHSIETKKKIGLANSVKSSGTGNSQYGTMWITNEVENKKIRKDEIIPDGWRKGRVLRITEVSSNG